MVSPSDIERAAEAIVRGDLVAFPTETVYGLGAHALDPLAVAKIFEAKRRPLFDPLIVHVAEVAEAERLVTAFGERARRLAERFWPGPLTLVLPKRPHVPDLVTSGSPTVAVRVPDHPVALALLRAARVPIAAPSANLFGRVSPTTAEHVREQLGDAVACLLDGGPCRVGIESTVLSLLGSQPVVLRHGGVSLEELREVLPDVVAPARQASGGEPDQPGRAASVHQTEVPTQPYLSPGELPQHYAPMTPLLLVDQYRAVRDQPDGASTLRVLTRREAGARDAVGLVDRTGGAPLRLGLLAFRAPLADIPATACEVLSPEGNLREAASRFFAALRRLDAQGCELIVAESFPAEGLGLALNDRLSRAAAAW